MACGTLERLSRCVGPYPTTAATPGSTSLPFRNKDMLWANTSGTSLPFTICCFCNPAMSCWGMLITGICWNTLLANHLPVGGSNPNRWSRTTEPENECRRGKGWVKWSAVKAWREGSEQGMGQERATSCIKGGKNEVKKKVGSHKRKETVIDPVSGREWATIPLFWCYEKLHMLLVKTKGFVHLLDSSCKISSLYFVCRIKCLPVPLVKLLVQELLIF